MYGEATRVDGVGVRGVAENYGAFGGRFTALGSGSTGVYGSGLRYGGEFFAYGDSFSIGVNTSGRTYGLYSLSGSGTAGYFSSSNGYGLIVEKGNVGIGTDSPGSRFEIKAASGNSLGGLQIISSTNSNGVIRIQDANPGDQGQITVLAGGSNKIVLRANGYTYFNGGNVGIGTTNPGSFRLAVNGSAAKPGGGSWSTFSDERLKTIYGTFDAGLEEVLKLQPIIYRYNKHNSLNLPDEGVHIGFSAQEVQKVVPEAVSENNEGYLLVNNDPIMWTMLNAIKEQQEQIKELNSKEDKQIAALKAENKQLKERLDSLEDMLLALSATPSKEKLVKWDQVNIDKVQKAIQ